MSDDGTITQSKGNVFADLGFDDPEEEQLKAQLVREIRDMLSARGLTQAKAAELLALKQPDVSALINGRTMKFSLERLLRCIRRLDGEVTLVVKHRSEETLASQLVGSAS